jgi:hypothetical protein
LVTKQDYRSAISICEGAVMAKRKDNGSEKIESSTSSDALPSGGADATKDTATAKTATDTVVAIDAGAAPPVTPVESLSAAAPEPAAASDGKTAAPPPGASAPSRRFLHLAASVALAAALGAVLGSLGSAGIARLIPHMSASAAPSSAAVTEESRALRRLTSKLAAEVAALKKSVDASNRSTNSQFAKISDRLEHARSEPMAKLARITETLDRLEKRVATETTGSVSTRQATAAPAKLQEKLPEKPPVVRGWTVRDIYDGRALVEGNGELYEIGPGSRLPQLGRVETIRRQDGHWVVVTAKGLIVSAR